MWLWVFGIPEQAGIYDRWTATHIYDSIVDRRTDPAILYHYVWQNHSTGQVMNNLYRFQIFPLMVEMPRKAKITYQVPLRDDGNGGYQIPLPMGMADLSELPIERFTLRYYRGVEFGDAEVVELPDQPLVNTGTHEEMNLTGYSGNTLNLLVESLRPELYVGMYPELDSDTSFVQVGFRPSALIQPTFFGKKTVVLFDHSINELGNVTGDAMLQGFVNAMLPAFTEADSLNILFSGFVNQWMSESWMVTDEVTRNWITDQLASVSLSTYSNLSMLMVDAIEYLSASGGTIVLVSNSNQLASANSTSVFLQNMAAVLYGKNIRVHVVDCDAVMTQNESFNYGNQYHSGNAAAYQGLADISGGEYLTVGSMSLHQAFAEVSDHLEPFLMLTDINVTRTEGAGVQSVSLGGATAMVETDKTFGISSMVTGTGDVVISLTFEEINGNMHQFTDTIAENMVYPLDTVADNIWAGLIQRKLYIQPQADPMILSIIDHSKRYRVLSKYTAFLALEPAEGPLPGPDDPIVLTSVTEVESSTGVESIEVFPNPFTDMLTLDMALLNDMDLTIVLYDIHGAEVMHVFKGQVGAGRSMHSFDLSTLSPGVYVIRISDRSGMPLETLRAIKQ